MPNNPSNTAGTRSASVTGLSHRKRVFFWTFFLTILSAAFIFFRFNAIPANLAYDEAEFARLALSLSEKPYAPYSTLATGHATFYFYLLLGFFKVFGVNVFALRFTSALAGIAGVLLLYGILKKLKLGYVVAVGAPLIMATTRWYYSFARFSFEATFLLMLELTSLLLLLKFLASKRMRYMILSALFAGLAFHSYLPGRIYFLLPLAILFLKDKKALALFAGIFTFAASPLLIYFSQYPDTRVAQVSVFGKQGWVGAIIENCRRIVLMFFTVGDGNGRHNFPYKTAINPLLALLAVTGTAIGAWRRNKPVDLLFAVWLLLAIAPSLITLPSENPNMLRTFGALPAIAYFAARALELIFLKLKQFGNPIAYAAVGIIILASAAYDARTYFLFQSRVSRNAFEITCPLAETLRFPFKKLGDIPARCRVGDNLF